MIYLSEHMFGLSFVSSHRLHPLALILTTLGTTLALLSLPLAVPAHAAPLLFSDGFEESPEFGLWTSVDSPKWDTTRSNANSGARKAAVTGNVTKEDSTLVKKLSTLGYTHIVVSYAYRANNLEVGDVMTVQWSNDNGATWTTLFTVDTSVDDNLWHQKSHVLPPESENKPEAKLRFVAHLDSRNDFVYLDDVRVDGDSTVSTVDICPNIEGIQGSVPEGYELREGLCVLVATPTPSTTPIETPTPDPTPIPPTDQGNSGTGTIVIQQVVVGSSISFSAFSFQFEGSTNAFEADGTNTYIRYPSTFTITEVPLEDYTVTYGGDCNAQGSLTLGPGETVTCVITSTYARKVVTPSPTPKPILPTPTPTDIPSPTPDVTPVPVPPSPPTPIATVAPDSTPTPSEDSPTVTPEPDTTPNDQVANTSDALRNGKGNVLSSFWRWLTGLFR